MMNRFMWNDFAKTHSREEREAEAAKTRCTMCGKPFSAAEMDLMLDKRMRFYCDEPSVYAGKEIAFIFCPECFDRFLDALIPMCAEDPVIDEDYLLHLGSGLAPE